MAWDGPKWGQDDLFLTNPDLANILGRTDLDFDNFNVFEFLDPTFLDFQVPDFQNLAPGRAWAMLEPSGPARALAPLWLRGGSRTTKLVRSKELGQYRENPISASPVWGMRRILVGM